jgi:hypothetical protein
VQPDVLLVSFPLFGLQSMLSWAHERICDANGLHVMMVCCCCLCRSSGVR